MKYISQLNKGYMLVSSDDGEKFKVKQTGYPYKSTEFPSQTMLDNLLTEFHIKDKAVVQTVADLIELMGDKYRLDNLYTRREMCQMLEFGTIDPFSSELFECKYFSVYSISDKYASSFYKNIKDKLVGFHPQDEFSRGLFIVHWHKGVAEEDIPTSLPAKETHSFFDTTLCNKIDLHIEDFIFCLDLIYDNLDKLGLGGALFDPETVLESYSAYEISNVNGDTASRQLGVLINDILPYFNFFEEYMECRDINNPVMRTLKELFGCDLFIGVKNYRILREQYPFQLGLQCCVYPLLQEGVRKEECTGRIKGLVNEIAWEMGISGTDIYYIIKDDDIILLTSPYVDLVIDRDSLLLSKEKEVGLFSLGENEQMLGFNLGKDVKGLLHGIEYRLYQYVILINSSFGAMRTVRYYPDSKLELDDDKKRSESRGTWFSYRNALKAIVPNFDRLYLMGAYNDLPMVDILEMYYHVYDNSIHHADYTFALDYALDDSYTVEEKSFILMLGRVDAANRKSLINEDLGKLNPVLSEDFIKKLEVVFKIGFLVRLCSSRTTLATMIRQLKFDYKYEDFTFKFNWRN